EYQLSPLRGSYAELLAPAICSGQRPTTARHLEGIDIKDMCLAKLSWLLRSPIHKDPMSPTLPVSPAPSPRSSSLGAKHFIVFQNSVITIDSTLESPQTSCKI
ncbi:hypothetical protein LY78DRAFT_593325, partial [Colletotrichum sublineola]